MFPVRSPAQILLTTPPEYSLVVQEIAILTQRCSPLYSIPKPYHALFYTPYCSDTGGGSAKSETYCRIDPCLPEPDREIVRMATAILLGTRTSIVSVALWYSFANASLSSNPINQIEHLLCCLSRSYLISFLTS